MWLLTLLLEFPVGQISVILRVSLARTWPWCVRQKSWPFTVHLSSSPVLGSLEADPGFSRLPDPSALLVSGDATLPLKGSADRYQALSLHPRDMVIVTGF